MAVRPSETERIGDYQVVRQLDPSGGMGRKAAVAIKKDGDDAGRLVLLKRLEASGPRARKARAEIENAARLRHLANVKVIDHFTHERELVVVFEHDHDGPRLDQIQAHLERQNERFADGATLFLAYQLLNALAEAHEQEQDGKSSRMVHGHLGPDFVRINWDGRVRLVGLGLPSVFDAVGRSAQALCYRPPEYKATRIGDANGDVYAIAAMLWALFTGRRPPEDAKGIPKLATLRNDIPVKVASAVDSALKRTPLLRKITCRELATTLEKEVRSIADATELKWNMEVFRALSLFAGSMPPVDSRPPADSSPPPDDTSIPAPIPSRPSGTGPEPSLSWKSSEPPKAGATDDSVIQRLSDLFDALPAEPSQPADDEDRTSVDAGWDIEDGTEPREAERFSEVGAPPPSTPSPAAPVTVPDLELATIPAGDSAPPTEPEPVTEPSMHEMRATRVEGRAESAHIPPVPPTPKISEKPPVSSEPIPSTEPEPGRLAAPPPSINTHLRNQGAKPDTPGEPRREPADAALPPTAHGVPKATVAAIAAACIGIGFGAAWLLKPPAAAPLPGVAAQGPRDTAPRATQPPPPPGDPQRTTAPITEPGVDASASPSATPSATPSAESSAAASTAPSAAPAPDPGDLPPLPASDGRDGSELLSYQGYLIVRSSTQAQVFAQGINIGNTNEKLLTRCHQKNLRLRNPQTARWITRGQPVEITCMATTTVVIQPDAQ